MDAHADTVVGHLRPGAVVLVTLPKGTGRTALARCVAARNPAVSVADDPTLDEAHRLYALAKANDTPTLLVTQEHKEGAQAGSQHLAHMADVVLSVNETGVATRKNRWGPVD